MPFWDSLVDLSPEKKRLEADAAARKAAEDKAEANKRIGGNTGEVPPWGEGYIAGLGFKDVDDYRRMRYQADATRGPESIYAKDQGAALGQLNAAAMGRTPSAAEIQMRNQAAQAAQQQASIAAGARGGAGAQAAAARAASFNTANQSSQIAESAGQLRAQEMAQARDAYARYAGGYAGQDLQTQLAQRNINAGREGSYLAAEQQTRDRQAGQETGYQAREDAFRRERDARTGQAIQAGMQTAGTLAMVGAMSDIRAKEAISPTTQALREDDDTDQLGSDLARGRVSFAEYNERATKMREQNAADPRLGWAKPPGWEMQRGEAVARANNETPEEAQERKRRARAEVDDDAVAELLAGRRDPNTGAAFNVRSDREAKEKARATGQEQGIAATLSMLGRNPFPDSPRQVLGSLAVDATGPRPEVVLSHARDRSVANQRAVTPASQKGARKYGTGEPTAPTRDDVEYAAAKGLAQAGVVRPIIGDEDLPEVRRELLTRPYDAQAIARDGRSLSPGLARLVGRDLVANAVGQVKSDERGKSAQGGGVDSLLDTLAKSSSTYQYKDPGDHPTSTPRPQGQRFAGVMAQDLERVPQLGPGLVTNTPKGKVVEGGAALSALMAAVGRQEQKIDALAKRRKGAA